MPENNTRNPRLNFLINTAYWVVILAIAYLAFKYLFNQLLPLFLAFVFAAVVRPISKLLSTEYKYVKDANGNKIRVKRKFVINRKVAGVISVVVLYVVFIGLIVGIVIRLSSTISTFIADIPNWYYGVFVPGVTEMLEKVEAMTLNLNPTVRDTISEAIPNIITSLGSALTNISGKAVSWVANLATKLPSFLLNTVICLIATVFIAIDFDRIKSFIRNNLSEKRFSLIVEVRDSFLEMIWSFIKSYFIIFCITFAEIAVGLLLLGRDNPFLFAALVALFDAFPIVGSGMILLPWAIIILVTDDVVWHGIGMLLLYAIVVIVRQIIEPKIVGKQVGLRPVVTLTCMFIGTKLFGGAGLLGFPITAAIIEDLNSNGLIHIFNYPDEIYTEDD